jgi:uncharacterized protein
LEWRPDRVDHIAKHDVRPEEVEEAVFDDRRGLLRKVGPAERNPHETVYRYLGRTEAGRYLFVVLIHTERGNALPVTARDMTEAEKGRYSR